MDAAPLVSIGMPVYNGEPFLRAALDSLIAQDYQSFELLISDNASTDGTAEICQEYVAMDARVRYHRNGSNLGAIPNFDRLVGTARGDYFMWAAADDLWEPTYISTLLAKLMSHPQAALAFSAFDSVDERGAGFRTYNMARLSADQPYARLRRFLVEDERLGKANLMYSLMPLRVLRDAGGFKAWGTGDWGADMLVVFSLLTRGPLVSVDEVLFHKRLLSATPGPATLNPKGLSLRSWVGTTLASVRHTFTYGWYGYFRGYGTIIDATNVLTSGEKRRLRAAVRRRVVRYCRDEFIAGVVQPAARAARRLSLGRRPVEGRTG